MENTENGSHPLLHTRQRMSEQVAKYLRRKILFGDQIEKQELQSQFDREGEANAKKNLIPERSLLATEVHELLDAV